MRVSLHSFLFPIYGIFFTLNSISHVLLHISCLYHSVAPHNPCGFVSFLIISHRLQTLMKLLTPVMSFTYIKNIICATTDPCVTSHNFDFCYTLLLLFSFPFLSGSLPSSFLMFLSILKYVCNNNNNNNNNRRFIRKSSHKLKIYILKLLDSKCEEWKTLFLLYMTIQTNC